MSAGVGAGLLLLGTLSGCAEEPVAPASVIDSDHDGYTESEDCNDADPLIHPNGTELCDEVDNDCDGEIDEDGAADANTFYADADGDGYGDADHPVLTCTIESGYVDNQTDCNDETDAAWPGATEVCDGIDNDCDDNVDEATAADAQTYYLDDDEDGYGTDWYHVTACELPDGYSEVGGDCNDGDAETNPGAAEVCDGEGGDEDCDNLYDDEDDPVGGQTPWYPDEDGDGYGDEAGEIQACKGSSGYVEVAGDCDDEDPTLNPANAEICGDELDNDCDGDIDEEDAPYPIRWYTDADGDGYGDPDGPLDAACSSPSGAVANATDCDDSDEDIYPGARENWYDGVDSDCNDRSDYDADEDGYDSARYGGTDCDDRDETANPGMPELCGDGVDNDCDGDDDPCEGGGSVVGDNEDDSFGGAICGMTDWDGDGDPELVVGADRYDGEGSGRGAIYVISGTLGDGEVAADVASTVIYGESDQDWAGSTLACIPDWEDDGFSELAIGAPGSDIGGKEAGSVYVISGPQGSEAELADDAYVLVGEVLGDSAGSALANIGDSNDDGEDDLLIGAHGQDAGGTNAGAAYLLLGPVTDSADLSFAETRLVGDAAGEQAGFSVGGGDLNGDGNADLLVGAPYLALDGDYVGGAYVVYGPMTSSSHDLVDAEARWYGSTAGDLAGFSVGVVGDLDGDGVDDALVGAPEEDTAGTTAGAVYVVLGTLTGDLLLDDAVAVIYGENGDDYLGSALAAAGDTDGDGKADVLIGARLDDWTGSDAGAAYLLAGPLTGSIDAVDALGKMVGTAAGDWAGAALSSLGDLDGDKQDEIAVGAPTNDDGGDNAGAVLLFTGW